MTMSAQQEDALTKIRSWQASHSLLPFYLAGYAGTGKSTLLAHLREDTPMQVATYTGKAALVLRNKGIAGASTIHSMIYRVFDAKDKEAMEKEVTELRKQYAETQDAAIYVRIEKLVKAIHSVAFTLNPNAFEEDRPSLIAIDECSMVDKQIGDDLLSFGIPILVIGDPAQLPPVRGTGYFTSRQPDFLLTEIHRQAAGNPIIDLATAARNKQPIRHGKYGESVVVHEGDVEDLLPEFDQILCGTNKTRRRLNRLMRRALGFSDPLPETGDKLVCLRNNHQRGLLNGSLWEVAGVSDGANNSILKLTLQSIDDDTLPLIETMAHKKLFFGKEFDENDWRTRGMADEFEFGYALTVHKSQGSQWDKVCLFDESYCWRRDGSAANHLYTGVTRAAERIAIVK